LFDDAVHAWRNRSNTSCKFRDKNVAQEPTKRRAETTDANLLSAGRGSEPRSSNRPSLNSSGSFATLAAINRASSSQVPPTLTWINVGASSSEPETRFYPPRNLNKRNDGGRPWKQRLTVRRNKIL
jgi:hypothetical protein